MMLYITQNLVGLKLTESLTNFSKLLTMNHPVNSRYNLLPREIFVDPVVPVECLNQLGRFHASSATLINLRLGG